MTVIPALRGEFPQSDFRRLAVRLLQGWAGLIAIGLIWELAGRTLHEPWLPPISKVIYRLFELFASGDLGQHLLSSLTSLVIGFAIALVLGLVVGVLMGLFSSLFVALDVYVNAMLFTPSLIFAPILFAIFGLSDATRIGVVVIYSVFIIIINTSVAIRSVDRPLIEMAASFGARRLQTVFRVVFPDAFPLIVAGLRLGVGRAVKGMVNGELFIALVGIGGQAARYGKQFDFTSVWAISVFIMVLAIVINVGVSWLERRMTGWVE